MLIQTYLSFFIKESNEEYNINKRREELYLSQAKAEILVKIFTVSRYSKKGLGTKELEELSNVFKPKK